MPNRPMYEHHCCKHGSKVMSHTALDGSKLYISCVFPKHWSVNLLQPTRVALREALAVLQQVQLVELES